MIKNKIGHHLPPPIVFLGYMIWAIGAIRILIDPTGNLFREISNCPECEFGLAAILTNISDKLVIGLITFLLGGFLSLSTYGVLIDLPEKKLKMYNSFFGIKTGKWQDISSFTTISVDSQTKVLTTYSRANNVTSYSEKKFLVVIENEELNKEIHVNSFNQPEKANDYARFLAGNSWLKTGKLFETKSINH